MPTLNDIQKGKKVSPPRILVYGSEGVGKSTFAAGFPNPIFISTEDGIDQIDCSSFPLCKSFEDAISCLEALLYNENEYRTIVVDTLDWLERMIWDKVCKDEGGWDSIEKVAKGYGKGYAFALTHWGKFIKLLSRLRDEKHYIVVLVAHAKVESAGELESDKFKRLAPRLQSSAQSLINEWVDLMFLATRETGAAMGKDGGERVVCCVQSKNKSAKTRFDISEWLPMDANAVLDAIKEAQRVAPKGRVIGIAMRKEDCQNEDEEP